MKVTRMIPMTEVGQDRKADIRQGYIDYLNKSEYGRRGKCSCGKSLIPMMDGDRLVDGCSDPNCEAES